MINVFIMQKLHNVSMKPVLPIQFVRSHYSALTANELVYGANANFELAKLYNKTDHFIKLFTFYV